MSMRRLALLLLAACGSSESARPPQVEAPPSFASPDASALAAPCAESNKDPFVLSEARVLYRFNPPTSTFTEIGELRCGDAGTTATSMAIDRGGRAWVRYSDGKIWNVDTQSLACTPTAFVPKPSTEAFSKFGMGFSSVRRGSEEEELFVSDNQNGQSVGLALLDTKTKTLDYLGPYTGPLANTTCELTGTGDGRLYGFFVTQPPRIAEIAKDSGAISSSRPLPGVVVGTGYAFSFYAGDFYVYTGDRNVAGGSDVTRFRPSDGSITVVKSKVGFFIVGAGVSTCAPFEGPR